MYQSLPSAYGLQNALSTRFVPPACDALPSGNLVSAQHDIAYFHMPCRSQSFTQPQVPSTQNLPADRYSGISAGMIANTMEHAAPSPGNVHHQTMHQFRHLMPLARYGLLPGLPQMPMPHSEYAPTTNLRQSSSRGFISIFSPSQEVIWLPDDTYVDRKRLLIETESYLGEASIERLRKEVRECYASKIRYPLTTWSDYFVT